jgi:hypothetical protein
MHRRTLTEELKREWKMKMKKLLWISLFSACWMLSVGSLLPPWPARPPLALLNLILDE